MRQRFSFTIVVALAMLMIVTVIVAAPVKAETSGPIAIMGDNDLRSKAELYGWPGDGTADSPFVIADLTIINPAKGEGILIQDTSLHLWVLDCSVTGAVHSDQMGFGVKLYQTSNVTIASTTVQHSDYGLWVESSNNVTLRQNTITDSTCNGIWTYRSDDIDVVDNIVSGAEIYGILVERTSRADVIGNEVEGTDYSCLWVSYCDNITVRDNVMDSLKYSLIYVQCSADCVVIDNNCTLTSSMDSGIVLEDADHTLVRGNTVISGSSGIALWSDSDDNRVSSNHITVSMGYGISLGEGCNRNMVDLNDITGGYYGIGTKISDGMTSYDQTIEGNIITGASVGIGLELTERATVRDNRVSDSDLSDICLYQSNNIIIAQNTLLGGAGHGSSIDVRSSSYNHIAYNDLEANDNGVLLEAGSCHNLVEWNVIHVIYTISDVEGYGITICHGSVYNEVSNNTMSHAVRGIYADDGEGDPFASYNIFVNNTITSSEAGIEMNEVGWAIVADNIISGIGQGIVLTSCNNISAQRNSIQDVANVGIAVNSNWERPSKDINIDTNIIERAGGVGIVVSESTLCSIRGNTVLDSGGDGISIHDSDYCLVDANRIEGAHENGIYLYNVCLSIVSGNTIVGCSLPDISWQGIVLKYSSECIVEDNNIGSVDTGIYLHYSNECKIEGNVLDYGFFGIMLESCTENVVEFNTLNGMEYAGILLYDAHLNWIAENTVTVETTGIDMTDCSENIVEDNIISGSYGGINVIDCTANILRRNVIGDVLSYGIYLSHSNGDHVYENELRSLGKVGIQIDSCYADIQGNVMIDCGIVMHLRDVLEYDDISPMVITANNTVNGRPVLFIKNADMGMAESPAEVGEVILLNVANYKVTGLDLTHAGIIVAFSNNIIIEGNTITDAVAGIMAYLSDDCAFLGNEVCVLHAAGFEDAYGISLTRCTDNLIEGNLISLDVSSGGGYDLMWTGVRLDCSERNRIIGNSIIASGHEAEGRDIYITGLDLSVSNDTAIEGNIIKNIVSSEHFGTGISQMVDCNRNEIRRNTIAGWPNVGIYLFGSSTTIITGNTISASGSYGIMLIASSNNQIFGNRLNDNNGVSTIPGNTQASDTGGSSNHWNSAAFGNAWSDWTSPDVALPYGIIDVPYSIDGGALDLFPVVVYLEVTTPAALPHYTKFMPIDIGGTALDIIGITSVTWLNLEDGSTGACTGTSDWSGSVPLVIGENRIRVTITDAVGLSFSTEFIVVYTPGPVIDMNPGPVHYSNQSTYAGTLDVNSLAPITSGNWTHYLNGEEIGHGSIFEVVGLFSYSGSRAWDLGIGTNTIFIQMNDSVGIVSLYTLTIVCDTVDPTVSIDAPDDGTYNNTGTVTVTVHGSDDLSGIDRFLISLDGVPFAPMDSSATLTDLSDGIHTVVVRAYDRAGNWHDVSISFTVDTTDPALSIFEPVDGALFNIQSTIVRWTVSDALSGLFEVQIRLNGGEWYDVLGLTEFALSSLGHGTHVVEIEAVDHAGNKATSSAEFRVDTVQPSIDDVTDGFDVPVDGPISFRFSEAMNVTSLSFEIDGGLAGTVNWAGLTAQFRPTSSMAYNTTYTVTVTCKDLAGNVVSKTWSFTTTNLGGLSGTVTGPDGAPLGGVSILLSNGMSTTTDAQGRFSFSGVRAGNYILTITGSGYVNGSRAVEVTAGQNASVGSLSLHAAQSDEDTPGQLDPMLLVGIAALVAVVLAATLLFMRSRKK